MCDMCVFIENPGKCVCVCVCVFHTVFNISLECRETNPFSGRGRVLLFVDLSVARESLRALPCACKNERRKNKISNIGEIYIYVCVCASNKQAKKQKDNIATGKTAKRSN